MPYLAFLSWPIIIPSYSKSITITTNINNRGYIKRGFWINGMDCRSLAWKYCLYINLMFDNNHLGYVRGKGVKFYVVRLWFQGGLFNIVKFKGNFKCPNQFFNKMHKHKFRGWEFETDLKNQNIQISNNILISKKSQNAEILKLNVNGLLVWKFFPLST